VTQQLQFNACAYFSFCLVLAVRGRVLETRLRLY